MPRERYLLRADRTRMTYREILEVRPGSVRLLVPAGRGRWIQRGIATLIAVGYVLLATGAFQVYAASGLLAASLGGIVAAVLVFGAIVAGLFAAEIWWDNESLPLLAENPAASIPLEVFEMTSFGTFQEIRAKVEGTELRVAVHGRQRKVGEAMRFAGLALPPR